MNKGLFDNKDTRLFVMYEGILHECVDRPRGDGWTKKECVTHCDLGPLGDDRCRDWQGNNFVCSNMQTLLEEKNNRAAYFGWRRIE